MPQPKKCCKNCDSTDGATFTRLYCQNKECSCHHHEKCEVNNFLQVGRAIECGGCHPEKYPNCAELRVKYPTLKHCDCKCHDNSSTPQNEKCDCKELSCKKDCARKHTHKGFFCEKCEPEAVKKMYSPTPQNEKWVEEWKPVLETNCVSTSQVKAIVKSVLASHTQGIVEEGEKMKKENETFDRPEWETANSAISSYQQLIKNL